MQPPGRRHVPDGLLGCFFKTTMQRRNGRQRTMKIKHSRYPIPAVMQSRRGACITSTVPAPPHNCNGIREITMTDRPDVSPWRKLIGITLLSSLFVLPAPVLVQDDEDDSMSPVSRRW